MLQCILHGAPVGLALPSAKFGTVIFDNQAIAHVLEPLSRHKQATIHEIRSIHHRFTGPLHPVEAQAAFATCNNRRACHNLTRRAVCLNRCCAKHFDARAVHLKPSARKWRQAANMAVNLIRRPRPINARLGLVNFIGIANPVIGLRHGR